MCGHRLLSRPLRRPELNSFNRFVARQRSELRGRLGASRYRRRWGFSPPPPWADWVGYEALLEEIERHRIGELSGDVLEIGAFLGGGTAKLCDWFARNAPEKRVVSVDVFDPEFDATATIAGWSMRDLYGRALGGRDQREVFDSLTAGRSNLVVVAGDSTAVEIPVQRLAFAFVDGSHVPSVVHADFDSVWERLSPGGIVAFHDYGGDLPAVTETLHRCIGDRATDIRRLWTRSPLLLFLQRG